MRLVLQTTLHAVGTAGYPSSCQALLQQTFQASKLLTKALLDADQRL